MEAEEKNKETDQNDLSNNQNINPSDISHNNYNNNNSEIFRQMNNQEIKANEEKIKDSKEKTMEIKEEINNEKIKDNDITPKNNDLMKSTFRFFDNRKNYYLKIKRFLTPRIKKLILIVLLIISVFFVFISIFDSINAIKKTGFYTDNKFLMNNLFVFMLQMIYALCLLFFEAITIILDHKDNILFRTISILFISIIIILRIALVIKNDTKNITLLLNILSCFCLTFINLGIFLITLKTLKMKKNEQQNIDLIINFTDITDGKINDKKNNQLQLNNSGADNTQEIESQKNKEGITSLVEEANSSTNNNANNQSNIEQK